MRRTQHARTGLAAVLVVAALAAGTGGTAAQDPVTLTFWHTYNEQSPENDTLTGTLIPAFEAANPGVTVETLSVPYDDFRTKLIAALAAGTGPDLIRSDIIWVPELADMGALLPLDQAMPDFTDLAASVYAGPLSTNVWDGATYGLPLDTNTKVWLTKDTVYEGAGLTPAATIDQLLDQCQTLKAADPDAYLFAADGTFAWVVLPWIWSFGGDILDADMTTASGVLDGERTVAAYEYLLQLYDAGCVAPVILGDGVDPFSGFGQGIYASLDNGPWTYPILAGQFPDAVFTASPFPAGTGGSIDVVGGEDVNVLASTAHQTEALDFVRFLLSDEYQLTMAGVGQIPVRADLDTTALLAEQPQLGAFLDQLETARARPAHPRWTEMDQALTDAGQRILRHEQTPQEALTDAATAIDAIIAGE
jgi:multiple sugar transport system substrate-binding protein